MIIMFKVFLNSGTLDYVLFCFLYIVLREVNLNIGVLM